MSIRWKSLLLALALIAAVGAIRLPLEQRYTENMRREQLLETPLNLSMRDELGQTFFIAVLGGFRSVVASLTGCGPSNTGSIPTGAWWMNSSASARNCDPGRNTAGETRAWHLAARMRATAISLIPPSPRPAAPRWRNGSWKRESPCCGRAWSGFHKAGSCGTGCRGTAPSQSKPGLRSGLPLLQPAAELSGRILLPARGAGTGKVLRRGGAQGLGRPHCPLQ